MGKYIYRIYNDINDKSYIGQSTNPQRRFTEHCSNKSNSLIHSSIVKYGKNKFHMDILGYYENYNEMEAYYIQKYNSISPNGYNIAPGGEEPPLLVGENNPNALITEEIANKIKIDLMDEKILRKTIKKKYCVSENIIRHINEGNCWHDDALKYPLRRPEEEITAEKVKQIKYYLKNTNLSQKEIAEMFGFKRSFVSMINIGKNHFDKNEDYPIRKAAVYELSQETINKIIEELKNTSISINKIAEKRHISKSTISRINLGKTYHNPNISYPIRK